MDEEQRGILADKLSGMSRDELNIVGKKLRVKGYRKKKKEELVSTLLDSHSDKIHSVLSVT